MDCVARTSNKGREAENLLLIDNFATCKNMSRNVENVKAAFLPSRCVISLDCWKFEITHSGKSILQTFTTHSLCGKCWPHCKWVVTQT